MSKPRGCGIDDGYDSNHRRASGEVARPLPVIAAPRSPKICPRLHLDYAWPDLAGKASPRSHLEPLPTRYRTYLGKVWPKARLDRSKWLHGLPDGCAMLT